MRVNGDDRLSLIKFNVCNIYIYIYIDFYIRVRFRTLVYELYFFWQK